jgi:P27 family predicted phage terminase small subunit
MGERGPARKPTALINLNDNAGHHKKSSLENEPTPELKIPDCPSDLQSRAREAWYQITELLYENGLVSELDEQALKTLCVNIQVRDELLEYLQSYEVELDNGTKVKGFVAYFVGKNSQTTPEWKAYREAEETIMRICKEFGMTPSARSRMKVLMPVKTEPGGIEEFIDG